MKRPSLSEPAAAEATSLLRASSKAAAGSGQLTFELARPMLPVLAPMARRSDMETSHEAAASIEPKLGKIQREVLEALAKHGPLTARALEALPEFGGYGFSTVRKRLSELSKSGHVVPCGVDRSQAAPATIWKRA